MKRMNQILSVLLLLSLLPIIPLVSSAERENGKNTILQTVYVSQYGDNTTAVIGDKSYPYADFLTAYGQLTSTGGTVVLLDDIMIDMSGVDKIGDADRIYLPKSIYTINVCGVYHEDNGAYSALHMIGGDAGVCFELEGNVVFYDMIFRIDYGQNLWFAANGYDLTFGFHITNETSAGKFANITGGSQNAAAGVEQNPNGGPTVSVYSGEWNGIYGGSFAGIEISGEASIRILGGSFKSVTTCRNNAASKNALKYPVVIHYYGGAPAVIKNYGKEATFCLYNVQSVPLSVETDFEDDQITVCGECMPAPDYALHFYGTQVTKVNAEDKYSVRFVGTLNSADYSAVGMLIQTGSGKRYGGCCEKIYTSVKGGFERYTAEDLGGNYIFAWTIQNVPVSAGEVSFTVTPFFATKDTVWYGQAKTIVYQSGVLQQ